MNVPTHGSIKKSLDHWSIHVRDEAQRAVLKFPAMASMHEAEAIIREEMDELTEAIRLDYAVGQEWPTPRVTEEATQLAAMCLRLLARV